MYERKGFIALLRRDPPSRVFQLRRSDEEGRRAGTPKPVYYSKRAAVSARVKSGSEASSRVRPSEEKRGCFLSGFI